MRESSRSGRRRRREILLTAKGSVTVDTAYAVLGGPEEKVLEDKPIEKRYALRVEIPVVGVAKNDLALVLVHSTL